MANTGTASLTIAELREKGSRLHGKEHRNIRFEELAKLWLESIRPDLKESSWVRRGVFVNQLTPYFKGLPVRSIWAMSWLALPP